MSRLRKTVVPFRWSALSLQFQVGTAKTVDLAASLSNPQGYAITYSVVGTLPTGVTLSGSVVSYSGAGSAGTTTVQFRAQSGGYRADSAPTGIVIAPAPVTNTPPVWTAATPSSLGTYTAGVGGTFSLQQYAYDADGDPVLFYREGGASDTAPGSVTINETTGLVTIPSDLPAGTYTVVINAVDDVPAGSGSWEARSTAPDVVWAHPLESSTELSNFLVPASNGDLGADVTMASPANVRPHLMTDGVPCLEILQIGATVVSSIPEVTTSEVPILDYPTATLVTSTTTVGTMTLPILATDLGLAANLSTFKILNGANAGIYVNIRSGSSGGTPSAGNPTSFAVQTSARTPFADQTGLQLQHVLCQSLSNPFVTFTIDEHVDELGGRTWPSPNGWVQAGDPIPSDAYSIVVHQEWNDGVSWQFRDKLTVVRADYNASTKLTTITARRASLDAGTAGRHEAPVVNRYFPCAFPAANAPVGTEVIAGRDVTGGWGRPLAALVTGDNGIVGPLGEDVQDPAASNTVTRRTRFNPSTGVAYANFNTGYYGSTDYHGIWTPTNRLLPNTLASNGEYVFDGNEFWLSWLMKVGTSVQYRTESTKLFFIDQYQSPDNSQIVGSSYRQSRPNWSWFHNYGSDSNSTFPTVTWEPPFNEWFGMMVHLRGGHDNEIDYLYTLGSLVVSQVSRDDTAETMTIDCTHMPLKAGMTRNGDGTGGYFVSEQNPQGYDPTTGGYFGSASDLRYWQISFRNPSATSEVAGPYKISSHTVVGGNSRYVLTKKRTLDVWPVGAPTPIPAGWQVKIEWIDKDTSARYSDSVVELWKRQASDTDWVLLSSFTHPITFNRGDSAASAENAPGWNQFMPTGYANIDDLNPPVSRSTWTRFAQPILSKAAIAAPDIP